MFAEYNHDDESNDNHDNDEENASVIQDILINISNDFGVALITATHDNKFIKAFDSIYDLSDSKLNKITSNT